MGFPKLENSIARVKTPCLEVLFISLESYWSVDVENGVAWAIWTFVALVMAKRKVENRPDPGVCRWSATHRWKAFKESYKFILDLVPIGGLSKDLWTHKVPKVQTGTISGLLFGSPETKSHLDVSAAEEHKEYYMGEAGGFPWWVLWVHSYMWFVLAPKVFQNAN